MRHDPLSYTEPSNCLLDLLHKVHKAIDNLFTQDRLRHGDLRLPNICFNGRFDVVSMDEMMIKGITMNSRYRKISALHNL